MKQVVSVLLAFVITGYLVDEAAWLLRGSPTASISVSVLTAMEFKSGKEDYGEPEVDLVTCGARVLPGVAAGSALAPCWWVRQHSQVVRRP